MSAADALPAHDALLRPLLDERLIDDNSARRVSMIVRSTGQSAVAVIHQLALCDDQTLAKALAKHFDLPLASAADMPPAAIEIVGISATFLRRHQLVPLGWADSALRVAVIDPERSDGLAALAFAAGCATQPVLAAVSDISRHLDLLYGEVETVDAPNFDTAHSLQADTLRVRDTVEAGPAVRLVETIFAQALEEGASDIHIEPLPDRVRIRFRINGALRTIREEPAHLSAPIAARIKILADMDVADRRRPQDGRTSIAAKGRPVDVRVSSVPGVHGEAIVARLLRREGSLLDLAGLGFSSQALGVLEQALRLRRGLFLITGPTGSGKTTTLYAMIEQLRREPLKIISVEDPVEYFFPDITQVQVNEDAGVTFASALRSFLRQDPDVILVGEIRDADTARIATQAALTGHLVLATLHTNDAQGAVARMTDMGVEPFLISATLAGVLAQRLVRRICPHCAQPHAPTSHETAFLAQWLGRAVVKPAQGAGCSQCRQSGILGRLAVAEAFIVSSPLREAISDASDTALTSALNAQGFLRLPRAVAELAANGSIQIAEAEMAAAG